MATAENLLVFFGTLILILFVALGVYLILDRNS